MEMYHRYQLQNKIVVWNLASCSNEAPTVDYTDMFNSLIWHNIYFNTFLEPQDLLKTKQLFETVERHGNKNIFAFKKKPGSRGLLMDFVYAFCTIV